MKTEVAKEIALITAVILHEDILYGSIFETFDMAYIIAKDFVKLYPPETTWEDKIYDETIIKFAKQQLGLEK